MKFSEFVVFDATMADIQGADQEELLKQMLDALVAAGGLKAKDEAEALAALLRRESLGSTGIGRGIAVPHTKYGTGQRVIGMLARSRDGVDYNAVDGEPVHVFFLVLSPEEAPALHLRALEYILLRMRRENFARFIKRARDKEELNELLREADDYD